MKPLFIPTDFTLESLYPLHYVMSHYPEKKVELVLGHMVGLPVSITDLLQSRRSDLYRAIPESFTNALGMLKQSYGDRIASLQVKFIYGSTCRAFKNYLHANDIDHVYMLNDHEYAQPLAQSIRFTEFMPKCAVNVIPVSLHQGLKPGFVGMADLLTVPATKTPSAMSLVGS